MPEAREGNINEKEGEGGTVKETMIAIKLTKD